MTTIENPVYHEEAVAPTGQLSGLVSGILDDAQSLIRQQMSLIRAEFVEDLRRTLQVAQCFGAGIGLLALGTVMLLVSGVYLLEYLTAWPLWSCWAAIGGGSIVLGAITLFVGARILASYNPLPDKSFNAFQENVSCLTNRQT